MHSPHVPKHFMGVLNAPGCCCEGKILGRASGSTGGALGGAAAAFLSAALLCGMAASENRHRSSLRRVSVSFQSDVC